MSEDESYSLEMPFIPVQSNGGPFDDDAYCCGFEAGCIDGHLAALPQMFRNHTEMIHQENVKQIDLIAMRNGFSATFTEHENGWATVEFVRFQPSI